jgi:hypothetical protein
MGRSGLQAAGPRKAWALPGKDGLGDFSAF